LDTAQYPLFHEAVSLPAVRDWLGWDEVSGKFTNDSQLEHFYELITPTETEDDRTQTQPPKITSYSQVRELKNILSTTEAKRILLDPARTFFDAVTIAKRDELSRSWKTQVAEAINALQLISVFEVQALSKEDAEQLDKLRGIVDSLLSTRKKLSL
jgi:hypothetical protein